MRSSEAGARTEQVAVFDTTLRDGEQAAGVCFSLEAKREIALALEAMRVDVIEAGFPGASAGESAAVRAVAATVRDAEVCGLARALPGDIDAAWEAVREAARPRLHVFIGSSDLNARYQLRREVDEIAELARRAVARAHRHVDNVEFSPLDATRSRPEVLARVVRAALEAGARVINIPDTVGCARPDQVTALLAGLRQAVPELEARVLSFHGQDDLGLATANTLAAVAAGARQVELAVNGIGERAGNTPFEEVVMALAVHGAELGVHTGVDTTGICGVSRAVEARSGLTVSPNKPVVGANAFRHASGIHQDGVLKRRETYEVLDPAAIGHPVGTEIVLGKLSGRSGFEARLAELGVTAAPEALARAFARFQRVADSGRVLADDELRALCREDESARPPAACRAPRHRSPYHPPAEPWPGPGV